ncbi:hypothetical protein HOY82DRAFT_390472 [Tuber indicum]|nr:hypothetical protein HOY82DRAFT_390472 [Tuber indicum]
MQSRTCNEHYRKAHGMDLKKRYHNYEQWAYRYTQQAARHNFFIIIRGRKNKALLGTPNERRFSDLFGIFFPIKI